MHKILVLQQSGTSLQLPWEEFCGVGRTVKHLATRASLQRPLDNQILTPYQLFEFASQDISGITSFYVDSETIKKTAAILEP